MIAITVNGASREVEPSSVEGVLKQLEIPAEALLVEHNGVALHRREWADRGVAEGDALELVRIVAGG
jgi:sulfur carrier protein